MSHIEILESIALTYGNPVYIEIGVGDGNAFSRIAMRCREAHAVDPVYAEITGGRFWQMNSDLFFECYDGPLANLIFIDGSHWEDQVARDFENAEANLAPYGTIALHDTWAATEYQAKHGSDTAYKIAEQIEADPSWDCFTLPVFPGLTLARPRRKRFT